MDRFPPVLQRISDGLELTNRECHLSPASIVMPGHCVEMLAALLPFGIDDRALFFVNSNQDDVLHVALANGWGRCALGLGLPVPDVKTLPPAVALWTPRYIEPDWWRIVRFPTTLLVTFIDIPHDPNMHLTDLLEDLTFLSNFQHCLTHRKAVSPFNWSTDPYARLLPNFYDHGCYNELLPVHIPDDVAMDGGGTPDIAQALADYMAEAAAGHEEVGSR
jgi:hypothetical protein